MLRLSKYDGEKWFADTGSAIMNIACGFSNIEWIITKLKNNQQVIMNVYKTISDYDTKSSFAALIDAFIKIDGNDLYKPVFLTGKEYRLFKGSAKYNKNKQFNIVNQKETPKENKNLSWKEAIKEALSSSSLAPTQGGYAVAPQNNYNNIENEDLDPCDLVIIKDADLKVDRRNPVKTIPSAAIILYYIADNAEHELLMKLLRISLDVAAILAAVYSGGTSSIVIRLAEAGMALTDIAMMSEEIRNFLSDNGGEWFVENWDTIYLMVGMGFLSNFIIKGILAKGPALLESLKNIRNVPKNWYLFRKDLEKLIKELEAYEAKQAARIATNEIAEVVIKGDKYGLLRKILNLASSPEKYIEKVVQDLTAKGLSLKKTEEGLYEVIYNGKRLFIGKDFEVGRFLKQAHFKNIKNAEEFANKVALNIFRNQITHTANLKFKGIVYEVSKKGGILKWKFPEELSKFPNRAELSEYGIIEYNFRIPDKLLNEPYKGFGQKFLDESFEIYGKDIKGAQASWNEAPNYPGGSSLGYKQFWKAFKELGDENKALKTTTFYKTMSKKGISEITERSVYIDEYENVEIIIYNKNFNK